VPSYKRATFLCFRHRPSAPRRFLSPIWNQRAVLTAYPAQNGKLSLSPLFALQLLILKVRPMQWGRRGVSLLPGVCADASLGSATGLDFAAHRGI
jgi:hypothetical protein